MSRKIIRVGDTASFSKTLTETDVYNFAGICGDFNPVHVDKETAAYSKFGKQVCHGMLVASFISTVLGMYLPGPGTIYLTQTLRWDAPVYIGDTITATVTVEKKELNIVTLETIVRNQKKKQVVIGTATVMVSSEDRTE